MQTMAAVLFVMAFLPYIVEILNGKVQPAKGSWFIWAVLDSTTLGSMWLKHAVNGQIIGAVIGAWVVFAIVMKYGKPGWTKLEICCLIGAGIGLALALVLKNPLLALTASLGAVFVGAWPTFQLAWHEPEKAGKLAWTLWWLSCVCALIAVPQWTLADGMQPVVFMVIQSTVCAIIYFKPRNKSLNRDGGE